MSRAERIGVIQGASEDPKNAAVPRCFWYTTLDRRQSALLSKFDIRKERGARASVDLPWSDAAAILKLEVVLPHG